MLNHDPHDNPNPPQNNARFEDDLDAKFCEVRDRLSTKEEVIQHLRDYEEMEYCAEIISNMNRGNIKEAMAAINKINEEQAKREMGL